MNKLLLLVLGTGFLILLGLQIYRGGYVAPAEEISPSPEIAEARMTAEMKFGFPLDSFHIRTGVLQPNQFLSDLLYKAGVNYGLIDKLAKDSEKIYSVRKLRAGNPYHLVYSDTCRGPTCFIYEPNPFMYVRFKLEHKALGVELVKRDIDTAVQTASGTIEGSLWQTMAEQGLDYALMDRMEDALAWSVDFYHIQQGDRFKLIYEDLSVNGESEGVGRLIGAWFESSGKEYYSISYKSEEYDGFFDRQGRPMKKAFLKAPVKYSRISSSYNKRRFHPVKKRVIPHLGTDYAAPHGTPIYAVADGTITIASYTSGNGRYVKIRHDRVYETQYLHMSSIASGIRPGKRVSQGDVIGYVGATGLATGPHVCFRFWKNGQQVNHLRENLPEPDPMKDSELPQFFEQRDRIVQQLDRIGEVSVKEDPA